LRTNFGFSSELKRFYFSYLAHGLPIMRFVGSALAADERRGGNVMKTRKQWQERAISHAVGWLVLAVLVTAYGYSVAQFAGVTG